MKRRVVRRVDPPRYADVPDRPAFRLYLDMATTTQSALKHDNPTTPPLLVTIKQASAMLSISRSSIYLLIDSGQLNPIRIGRSVRLPVDQLEQFIADRLNVVEVCHVSSADR